MSQEDAAALLSEFVYQIDNLPAEVAFILEEIGWKDEKVQGELGDGMIWLVKKRQACSRQCTPEGQSAV